MSNDTSSAGWLEELVGSHLVSSQGLVETSTLKGQHVALYFSAHWCPPCQGFTPQLIDVYRKVKKGGNAFEIVYVSMDNNEDQFQVSADFMLPVGNVPAQGGTCRSSSATLSPAPEQDFNGVVAYVDSAYMLTSPQSAATVALMWAPANNGRLQACSRPGHAATNQAMHEVLIHGFGMCACRPYRRTSG